MAQAVPEGHFPVETRNIPGAQLPDVCFRSGVLEGLVQPRSIGSATSAAFDSLALAARNRDQHFRPYLAGISVHFFHGLMNQDAIESERLPRFLGFLLLAVFVLIVGILYVFLGFLFTGALFLQGIVVATVFFMSGSFMVLWWFSGSIR